MSSNYQNKYGEWSVVTGASEGIGRCIAIELAKKRFECGDYCPEKKSTLSARK
jgi:NAD(P)-dependent dehydrogenase (short-subunit alcohol dehydrogenase family)